MLCRVHWTLTEDLPSLLQRGIEIHIGDGIVGDDGAEWTLLLCLRLLLRLLIVISLEYRAHLALDVTQIVSTRQGFEVVRLVRVGT